MRGMRFSLRHLLGEVSLIAVALGMPKLINYWQQSGPAVVLAYGLWCAVVGGALGGLFRRPLKGAIIGPLFGAFACAAYTAWVVARIEHLF